MNRWQQSYGDAVDFVCISCAGPSLALEMSKEMELSACTNGYIATRDQMPKWGQLGCNGFIIMDEKLNVVCRKTKAFMEVRNRAFENVKEIVDAMLIRINGGKRGTVGGDGKSVPGSSRKKRRSMMKVENVRSVGDSKMDEQHRRCESALEKLVKERTNESLDMLRKAFEEHFREEEALMDERVYVTGEKTAKASSEFDTNLSMRTSHLEDHKRIMKLIEAAKKADATSDEDGDKKTLSVRELKAVITRAGLTFKDCVTKSDLRKRASDAIARTDASSITAILDAWKSHERYDQAYAKVLLQSAEKPKSCTKGGS
eukprot:g4582.t1